MLSRLKFMAMATPIIWLIVIAPLTILFTWWTTTNTLPALAWSMLLAPVASLWIFLSFQTANLYIKWPATQLIGVTTILMSVVAICSPLLLLLPSITVALLSSVLWSLLLGFAVWTAHNIRNTHITITSTKLRKSYRLLHLSDIHAGSRSKSFIDKVVNQAITHNADAIFITGDLLDSSAVNTKYLQPLSKFTCPVYLCLGNHERYVNLHNAIDAINTNNVKILRSETACFGELEIIGIDDADNAQKVSHELPLINRSTDKYQILLYHRPEGFAAAADNGIDLMLSGHTHAGQIWPFCVLVKRQFPLIAGKYQHNDATLYVSQGTGTWGPIMRLGTNSEMTLITLAPEVSQKRSVL